MCQGMQLGFFPYTSIRGCSTHCAMPNLTEETIKTLFIKSADILY